VSVSGLMADEALRRRIDLSRYVSGTVGMPTLTDIMNELAGPEGTRATGSNPSLSRKV